MSTLFCQRHKDMSTLVTLVHFIYILLAFSCGSILVTPISSIRFYNPFLFWHYSFPPKYLYPALRLKSRGHTAVSLVMKRSSGFFSPSNGHHCRHRLRLSRLWDEGKTFGSSGTSRERNRNRESSSKGRTQTNTITLRQTHIKARPFYLIEKNERNVFG